MATELRCAPRLLVAGTASGVGKTTMTAGLIAAATRRGLRVSPFKVGPDYIDPTYHSLAAGRPCRNLDGWLVPLPNLRALFTRAVLGSQLSVIEGVMGLYDGRTGGGEAGSTAEIAKLLQVPTVVVLDVAKQGRSAAAAALGFCRFDPDVPLAGFILNRVGSARHADLVQREVETTTGLPVFGAVPRSAGHTLPERHLGLMPSGELVRAGEAVASLADLVERYLDVDRLLETAARSASLPRGGPAVFPARPRTGEPAGLAVARDDAFSFYYEDNLDLLEAWGARLLPFSPLRDAALPRGCRGLYLGGGFPELFAARLAANRPLLDDVRHAARAGMPIYAECGGLMYLAEALTDLDGRTYTLAGVIPCRTAMAERRMALGYVQLRTRRDTLLCQTGRELRGHEFHWSRLTSGAERANAYEVTAPTSRHEGFADGNILASYVHLHFGSDPDLARRFVAALA